MALTEAWEDENSQQKRGKEGLMYSRIEHVTPVSSTSTQLISNPLESNGIPGGKPRDESLLTYVADSSLTTKILHF